MALSVDSKVKELMKNEAAAELLEKFAPGFKTNPQMKLVQALTFRKLCSFPQAGISAEKLEEIDAALRALGE
jgi:hypothetical protein